MMLFTDTITGTAAESECSDHNGWLVILDSDESALWMKTLRNNNEGLWHDIHSIQCTCYRNTDSEFQYFLLPEDGHKIANIVLKKDIHGNIIQSFKDSYTLSQMPSCHHSLW